MMQDIERTIKPFFRAPLNEETKHMVAQAIEGLGTGLKVNKVEFEKSAGGMTKIIVRMENGLFVMTA